MVRNETQGIATYINALRIISGFQNVMNNNMSQSNIFTSLHYHWALTILTNVQILQLIAFEAEVGEIKNMIFFFYFFFLKSQSNHL